jgi:hypothetical protein
MAIAALATAVLMAFNLVCLGTETTTHDGKKEALPYSETFGVDLASRRFCFSLCGKTFEIAKIEDTMITLVNNSDDMGFANYQIVDRETGLFQQILTGGSYKISKIGRCERAPFTGFPVKKF